MKKVIGIQWENICEYGKNLSLLAKKIVKKVTGNQWETICECKPIAIGKNNCEKSNGNSNGKIFASENLSLMAKKLLNLAAVRELLIEAQNAHFQTFFTV